jgi:3-dehydroquinate dehydratase-2
MLKKILLLHGPNLNLLGMRDVNHYGNCTLKDIENKTKEIAKMLDYDIVSYQSNHEGFLIDEIQKQTPDIVGIIINPGALTHYSFALYDALLDTKLPIVEVHLSNIAARENWRAHSVTAPAAIAMISGKKEKGYEDAVKKLVEHIENVHHK